MTISSAADIRLPELLEQTWKVFKSLTGAPEELRELQDAILLFLGSLRLLLEHVQQYQLSERQQRGLQDCVGRGNSVIGNVEKQLRDLREQKVDVEEVAKCSKGFIAHGTRMAMFYEGLISEASTHVLGSAEEVIQRSGSDSLTWAQISSKLRECGHQSPAIEENYFMISTRLQSQTYGDNVSIASSQPIATQSVDSNEHLDPQRILARMESGRSSYEASSSSSISRLPSNIHMPDADEELPGYDPGTRKTTTREKADMLERTAAIGNAEEAINNGMPVGADPPKYSFDAQNSSGNEMDDELAHYINQAVAQELKRRYKARELDPKSEAFVYSWLPDVMQEKFVGRPDIVSLLDAKSFTVMGYETAPRISADLEKLMQALQMSADGSGDDTIFLEAINTVKVMIRALARFGSIQNPMPKKIMSDLDILDYEHDTALAVDKEIPFPYEHFELAQQSYFSLLTYIMGMADLMKDIFAGHVFVMRSRQSLAQLCQEKRVVDRTAWIRKQLAGWEVVDEAVLSCRNWHRMNSTRELALGALEAWQQSVTSLLGNEPPTILTLTIISASGFRKEHSYRCVVNVGCTKLLHGHVPISGRHFGATTTTIKNTRNPVWDQEFVFDVPALPKMIDIMLFDCKYVEKELGHVRLRFAHVPGEEKSLHRKDLMFGFDEILTAPFIPNETSKGKEVEAPMLEFRLAWKGRYQLLEEAGLLAGPPGKMFRLAQSHVPMPFTSIPGQQSTSKQLKFSKQQL